MSEANFMPIDPIVVEMFESRVYCHQTNISIPQAMLLVLLKTSDNVALI